jgi:hypothetical protein
MLAGPVRCWLRQARPVQRPGHGRQHRITSRQRPERRWHRRQLARPGGFESERERVGEYDHAGRDDDVEQVVVAGRQHIEDGRDGIEPDQQPQHPVPAQQYGGGDGGPQRPGDVQRRKRRKLAGGLGFQHAGEDRHGRAGDVVRARQHPRRRDRIEQEHREPDQVAGDQGVALHREGRVAAPDEQDADNSGDCAVQDNVVPGGRERRQRMPGQPGVPSGGELAAELAADDDDCAGIPQASLGGASPELVHGIGRPQHQSYRDYLGVSEQAVPGFRGPPRRHEMHPDPPELASCVRGAGP